MQFRTDKHGFKIHATFQSNQAANTMRKLIPHPGLSLLLLAIWLLANNSFAPGHILLGGILAIMIPLSTSMFLPERMGASRPILAVKYLARLIVDILVANVQVALWILRPNRNLQPAFIRYDLKLDSPMAITVLSNTISLTPGTVSCDLSSDRRRLVIHSLHAEEPERLARHIFTRYEKPLLDALKP